MKFPKVGDKLKYCGVKKFWFNSIVKNAEQNLIIGKVYTLKSIELFSSWAAITLEETGNIRYSLSFFEQFKE